MCTNRFRNVTGYVPLPHEYVHRHAHTGGIGDVVCPRLSKLSFSQTYNIPDACGLEPKRL